MKIIFSKRCLEFGRAGHPESAGRVEGCYELIKKRTDVEFVEAVCCSDADILLVHSQTLLQAVKAASFFDPDTPALDNIFEYARLSAGAALMAGSLAEKEGFSFSLMRPPGHHAGKNSVAGFCYFNNIAVAVERLRRRNKKIAIIDFDCHHGNGTQEIFKAKEGVWYLSLHQNPLYPGTGLESALNCFNLPLAAGINEPDYLAAFSKGLEELKSFNPDIVAISAGFDSYKRDPLGGMKLEKTTFRKIGQLITGLKRPSFAVLEGGYSKDLPECLSEFLCGITSVP
jgi:acetoin utilization deacetylase AcuC-like enzyme